MKMYSMLVILFVFAKTNLAVHNLLQANPFVFADT